MSGSRASFAQVAIRGQLLLAHLDLSLAQTSLSDRQATWMRFSVLPAYECCRACYEQVEDLQAVQKVGPSANSALSFCLPGLAVQVQVGVCISNPA